MITGRITAQLTIIFFLVTISQFINGSLVGRNASQSPNLPRWYVMLCGRGRDIDEVVEEAVDSEGEPVLNFLSAGSSSS